MANFLSNTPEIGILVQHLCDIVSSQANEILNLKSHLGTVTTEIMGSVQKLEMSFNIAKENIKEELKQQIKSDLLNEILKDFQSKIDNNMIAFGQDLKVLTHRQRQLSNDVSELVDCFEKSLLLDENGSLSNNGNQIAEQLKTHSLEIENLNSAILKLNQKVGNSTFDSINKGVNELKNSITNIDNELSLIKDDVFKIGNIAETDFQSLSGKIVQIEEYIGSRTLTSSSILLKIQEVSAQKSTKFLDFQNTIDDKIQSKVSFNDLNEILKSAASVDSVEKIKTELHNIVESLADKTSMSEYTMMLRSLDQMKHQLTDKSDNSKIDQLNMEYTDKIRDLEKGIKCQITSFKKNTFDKINYLVDSLKHRQENYTEVCGIVHENVMKELGLQLYEMGLQISDIKSLHLNFPIEATYIWKNAQLFQSCIVWDYETLNTSKDLISWKPHAPAVSIAEAGIYQISLAFFTTHKPLVKVLLNNEKLFTIVNSPTFIIGHDSGYINDNGKVRRGSKCGLSITEYVRVVKNSKLMIMFQGKTDYTDGFLRLAKVQ
eukprot:NODE_22_length_42145_cov_1.310612.p6 type:complete len:546 gc:universal NODE_22_length_42145_cov_1.310612:37326-38963(+)